MGKQKAEVNKSAAIREIYAANPKAKMKEVAKALADKGIDVTPTLIYLVKGKLRRKKRKARAQAVAASNGAAPKELNPVDLIVKVKNLAAEIGGMPKLKTLLDVLNE